MEQKYAVYILASRYRGTIYTGVTNQLLRRVWEHKQGMNDGFTHRYHVKTLVWYELHNDVAKAIRREKQIKQWKREWKINLIERGNPQWCDLYQQLL